MNRSCNAPASADSLGYRVGHIAMAALLLMGLSLMCILMVNLPGSRAMAAAPAGSFYWDAATRKQRGSAVERIAARSTQEPGDTTVKPRRRSSGVQVASLGHDRQPSHSDAPSVGGGAVAVGGLVGLSPCNAAPHRWRAGGCVWASHGQLDLPQPVPQSRGGRRATLLSPER